VWLKWKVRVCGEDGDLMNLGWLLVMVKFDGVGLVIRR